MVLLSQMYLFPLPLRLLPRAQWRAVLTRERSQLSRLCQTCVFQGGHQRIFSFFVSKSQEQWDCDLYSIAQAKLGKTTYLWHLGMLTFCSWNVELPTVNFTHNRTKGQLIHYYSRERESLASELFFMAHICKQLSSCLHSISVKTTL